MTLEEVPKITVENNIRIDKFARLIKRESHRYKEDRKTENSKPSRPEGQGTYPGGRSLALILSARLFLQVLQLRVGAPPSHTPPFQNTSRPSPSIGNNHHNQEPQYPKLPSDQQVERDSSNKWVANCYTISYFLFIELQAKCFERFTEIQKYIHHV